MSTQITNSDTLFKQLLKNVNGFEKQKITEAYTLAKDAHEGQYRKSGEPYITHPLHVAKYLAEIGMDEETVIAAILHDVIEDTSTKLTTIKKKFGKDVGLIVDGVTKLDKINFSTNEEAQAESIRKMVIAMSKDVRVLILKLADRLHNIETIQSLPEWKQQNIASETLYVYSPLAHRLGLQNVKHQLEDKSFSILFPEQDEEISNQVSSTLPGRKKAINKTKKVIDNLLSDNSISAEVSGRPKHNYSIYKKIINNGLSFTEINDLIGIRIICSEVSECYTILGLIHANFQPVQGRFKDFISMPKFNLYQSLHTTVLSIDGKKMEIQIRTHEMHSRAEHGVAAHWMYKDQNPNDESWKNEINRITIENPDPSDFLKHIKLDLYEDEVFTLTPHGDIITLPTGSTPVDFAYAVHTVIGEKLSGAKVNGKLVNLGTTLKSGDTVEIITSTDKDKGPSRDWLSIAKTSRAQSKIKNWFIKQNKNQDMQNGKAILNEWFEKNVDKKLLSEKTISINLLLDNLNIKTEESLFVGLAKGTYSIDSVGDKLLKIIYPEEILEKDDLLSSSDPISSSSNTIIVEGYDDIQVRMAKCCVPVPGDDIVGFITISNGIAVHVSDCLNVEINPNKGERIVDVGWSLSNISGIIVWLEIEAIDRPYLLRDATIAISDNGGNILIARSTTNSKRIVTLVFQIEISDGDQVENIIIDSKKISNVFDAKRIFPGKV